MASPGMVRDPNIKPEWGAALDVSNPLTQGLVNLWVCNEGDGKFVGDLGSDNKVLATTTAWGADGLLASGSNGAVASSLISYAKWTMTAYVRPTNINGSIHTIWRTLTGTEVGVYIWSNNQVSFYLSPSAAPSFYGGVLVNGVAYMIVVTSDGTTQTMYVNGVQVGSAAVTNAASGVTLNILQDQFSQYMAGGGILFARHSRVLSPQENKTLSDQPYSIFLPPNVRRFYSIPTNVIRLPSRVLIPQYDHTIFARLDL